MLWGQLWLNEVKGAKKLDMVVECDSQEKSGGDVDVRWSRYGDRGSEMFKLSYGGKLWWMCSQSGGVNTGVGFAR